MTPHITPQITPPTLSLEFERDERKTGGTKRGARRRPSIADRFDAYLFARPDVYELLVKLARDVKARGKTSYSMKAIFERARWHFHIEKGEDGFVLNNDFTALFARRIMERERDLDGFFETRRRRAT